MVAGDDDQSIYGFRHAMGTTGMMRFEQEFGARRFLLGRNYRSVPPIVLPAGRLIRRNMQRVAKTMHAVRPARGADEAMRVAIPYPTVLEESVDALVTMVGHLESHPEETGAILARTNRQLQLVRAEYEMAGERYGIPARIRNTPLVSLTAGGLQDDAIGAILMTLFRTLARPEERRGIETLMVHFLGFPPGMVDPLLKRGFSHIVQDLAKVAGTKVRGARHAQLEQLASTHPGWIRDLELAGGDEYGRVLRSVTGQLVSWMCEVIKLAPEGEYTRRDERILWALRHQVLALAGRPLSVRLQQLREAGREAGREITPGTLVLATMHGAKGMEFDRVWILQCNQGVVPHHQNPVIEEERRLFYVAMTRAKSNLYLSCDLARPASVFLSDMES
jgi:superfamily I DNA/RNA helicase